MNELEFKMLLNKKKRSSAMEEPGDSSEADEVLPDKIIEELKKNAAKRKTDVKDKVQFKRKRAKGPNPLSCKKKKNENQKHVAKKDKDVLFEPVRKTQDAMFFVNAKDDLWAKGAIQITMQDLAAKISPPLIIRADFDKVMVRQRPTVSKKDLELHERFTKEFGEALVKRAEKTRKSVVASLCPIRRVAEPLS